MTEDRQRFALRLVAFGGVWLLVSGLLLALSFVAVAMAALGLFVSVLIALAVVAVLRRIEAAERLWTVAAFVSRAAEKLVSRIADVELGPRVRRSSAPIREAAVRAPRVAASSSRAVGARVRRRAKRVAHGLGAAATHTPDRLNHLLARALQTYALGVQRLTVSLARLIGAGRQMAGTVSLPTPRPQNGSREAFRLNELGAELRRRGDHQRAAEKHRVALAIARDAGDGRAEALTLNNLALALAQGGADAEAVRHLEQALNVLRELGDEKHEARVIANLGIVHSRQGHNEEAVTLLHEALDKLPPESKAYLQVKEELTQELSRAS